MSSTRSLAEAYTTMPRNWFEGGGGGYRTADVCKWLGAVPETTNWSTHFRVQNPYPHEARLELSHADDPDKALVSVSASASETLKIKIGRRDPKVLRGRWVDTRPIGEQVRSAVRQAREALGEDR